MEIEKVAEEAKKMLPKKAEARDAAPAPSAETTKTKEEVTKDVVKLAEEQAAKDEAILSKKDEELNDSEKGRKAELVKVKAETEEREKKSNVQKRIDELTSKIKLLEADNFATKAEKDALKTELDGIKKHLSMTPQDKIKEKVVSETLKLRSKYAEEDKTKPREERREMPQQELNDWLLEDYEGATEWITKRTLRRAEDERNVRRSEEETIRASDIVSKQNLSAKRVQASHPELDIAPRQAELMAQGKSKEEALKIICAENKKFKLCLDIYNENQEKYLVEENAPELIVKEMEKRMNGKEPSKDDVLQRELAEARAEIARLKGLDSGVTSTRSAAPAEEVSELTQKQIEIGKRIGLSPERIKVAVQRRREMGYDG